MRQAVSTFSNAAARTAAITAPSEGMLTYLEDVNRYEWWTGSAWRSPFGTSLITSVAFTSQAEVSLSNVFSSAYQNYALSLNITAVSGSMDIQYRLRTGSTDNSANSYFTTLLSNTNASASTTVTNVSPGSVGLVAGVTTNLAGEIKIFSPNLATNTYSTHQVNGLSGDLFHRVGGTLFLDTTVFDGITVRTSTGTMTGNLRLYGLRND
jgi:hypothetical protein